jgi:hypothetical protein
VEQGQGDVLEPWLQESKTNPPSTSEPASPEQEQPASPKASPAKEQTKEKKDNDIDNSRFAISRSIKGQRKIKIIDAD